MLTFIVSAILAAGVPAAARGLRKVSTRQAIAFGAALWALAQPEYFGITVGRMLNFGDVGATSELVVAAVGGVTGAVAGVWAAFFASHVNIQRLLYVVAAGGAAVAAIIWTTFLPGLVISILVAVAFLGLAASPRPFERQPYSPRRLHRHPR